MPLRGSGLLASDAGFAEGGDDDFHLAGGEESAAGGVAGGFQACQQIGVCLDGCHQLLSGATGSEVRIVQQRQFGFPISSYFKFFHKYFDTFDT